MRLLSLISCLGLLAISRPVLAGPNESPVEFTVNPANPDFWALRYTHTQGGFVFSFDGGETWKVTCNAAIDAVDDRFRGSTYGLALASDGTVFSGDFHGVLAATDNGCNWDIRSGGFDNWASAFALDAQDPTRVLAVTSYGGKMNGLWAYDAHTQIWSVLGVQELSLGSRSLLTVSSADKLRIYTGSSRGARSSGSPNFLVRYSEDDGASWTEHAFPEDLTGEMFVVAVDPNNAARIAVTEQYSYGDPRKERLWLNENSGDPTAFQLIAELEEVSGAAFDQSGALYFGDRLGELYRLDVGASEGSAVGDMLRPYCVTYEPTRDAIFVCQFDNLSQLDPATGELTEIVSFRSDSSLITMLDCGEATDVAALCEGQLADAGWCIESHYPYSALCDEYGFPGRAVLEGSGGTMMTGGSTGGAMMTGGSTGGATMTGGSTGGATMTGGSAGGATMTGGAVTGMEPAVGAEGGCGCRTSGAPVSKGFTLIMVLMALGLIVRRRQPL